MSFLMGPVAKATKEQQAARKLADAAHENATGDASKAHSNALATGTKEAHDAAASAVRAAATKAQAALDAGAGGPKVNASLKEKIKGSEAFAARHEKAGNGDKEAQGDLHANAAWAEGWRARYGFKSAKALRAHSAAAAHAAYHAAANQKDAEAKKATAAGDTDKASAAKTKAKELRDKAGEQIKDHGAAMGGYKQSANGRVVTGPDGEKVSSGPDAPKGGGGSGESGGGGGHPDVDHWIEVDGHPVPITSG